MDKGISSTFMVVDAFGLLYASVANGNYQFLKDSTQLEYQPRESQHQDLQRCSTEPQVCCARYFLTTTRPSTTITANIDVAIVTVKYD